MPEVNVYSTPSCPWCSRVKQFLEEHGIDYEDYDVAQDPAKAEEMIQKTGQMGVPVTDIDGEMVIGFDQARLQELLGLDGD
jgi:glutaredoxin-like YruB-family protein